jgi:hypothetical protein
MSSGSAKHLPRALLPLKLGPVAGGNPDGWQKKSRMGSGSTTLPTAVAPKVINIDHGVGSRILFHHRTGLGNHRRLRVCSRLGNWMPFALVA